MRLLEVVSLVSVFCAIISLFIRAEKRFRWMHLLPAFSIIVLLIHLFIEGYRWQMIPTYILGLLLFLFNYRNIKYGIKPTVQHAFHDRKRLRISGTVGSLLVFTVAFIPLLQFPLFELPKPTGPCPVGTAYFHFVDESRKELYAEDPSAHRELSVQVWYPAAPKGREPVASYLSKGAARAVFSMFNAPQFIGEYLSLIPTHSHINAPVLKNGSHFPIVFFSSSGDLAQTQALNEELASHGYVVFSVNHPYFNAYSIKANGEVVPFSRDNLHYREIWRELNSNEVGGVKSRILASTGPSEQEASQRELDSLQPLNREDVIQWSEDMSYVADQFWVMNGKDGFFSGTLDLDRIGVFGFSKGGTASYRLTLTDSRCTAGINMDGFMYGDILDKDLMKPFMFMQSENPDYPKATINDYFYQKSQAPAYYVKIKGARSVNFTDASLFQGQLHRGLGPGPIDERRCVFIVREYIRAFFDKHLKDKDSGLLKGPSTNFPEVEIKGKK